MSQPFTGEIRCFGFNFAPFGWAFCNGQTIAISQNTALFSILGTTYGGNGQTTFALPDLRGQVPMHWGNGPGGFTTVIGQPQGSTNVTLNSSQMPIHTHAFTAAGIPTGGVVERTAVPGPNSYLSESQPPNGVWQTAPTINTAFSGLAVSTNGGSLPHNNMQPYLAVNFCISLFGAFPSRN